LEHVEVLVGATVEHADVAPEPDTAPPDVTVVGIVVEAEVVVYAFARLKLKSSC